MRTQKAYTDFHWVIFVFRNIRNKSTCYFFYSNRITVCFYSFVSHTFVVGDIITTKYCCWERLRGRRFLWKYLRIILYVTQEYNKKLLYNERVTKVFLFDSVDKIKDTKNVKCNCYLSLSSLLFKIILNFTRY